MTFRFSPPPRGAPHKVLDGHDQDEAPRLLVDGDEDATAVRADDLFELRRRVAHCDEPFAGVCLRSRARRSAADGSRAARA